MKQSVTTIARWANILLIIITLFSYLSPIINPDSVLWPISLLGLIYPILIIGHIVFILYWLNQRKWYFLLSVGCLLVGWSSLTKNIAFYKSAPGEEAIRMLSFNIQGSNKFCTAKTKKGRAKFNVEEFIEFLENRSVDIAVLQEFVHKYVNMNTFLDKLMAAGFYAHRPPDKSMLILSKYPIGKTGELAFENSINGCLFADLSINNKIVRVYNIHLRSNQISLIADEVAEEGNFREKETWQMVRGMFANYKNTAQIRAKQSKKIGEHIRLCPHPVLVGGDFNDVPQSFAYRQLAKGLQDSFQEKGRGIGTTFSGSLPFLRIDYILVSPRLEVLYQKTERQSKYSDHYPVLAEVKWLR